MGKSVGDFIEVFNTLEADATGSSGADVHENEPSSINDGGLALHLYTGASGNWFLSTAYTPEKNSGIAWCAGAASPLLGEHALQLNKTMRGASDGEAWVKGELTLLCGDAGAARAVRGLAQLALPQERTSCSVSGTRERVIAAARFTRS